MQSQFALMTLPTFILQFNRYKMVVTIKVVYRVATRLSQPCSNVCRSQVCDKVVEILK